MAKATWALVDALHQTAARLGAGAHFRWTHMGACICGHLAQTLTDLPPDEIHRRALRRPGDWAVQASALTLDEYSDLPAEHCKTTGLPLGDVFDALLAVGLSPHDIARLERLSHPDVLRAIPLPRRRHLDYREAADVVLYLTTWAGQLEARLAALGIARPVALAA